MDARKICLDAVTITLVTLLGGCEAFQPAAKPAARPADPQPDPPQVVKSTTDKPVHAADEQPDPLVAEYIRRIDDIAARRSDPRGRERGAALAAQPAAPSPGGPTDDVSTLAPSLPTDVNPARDERSAASAGPAERSPAESDEARPAQPVEPPAITRVSVRGETRPLSTAAPEVADAPAINAAVESRYGPTSLRDFLARLPAAEAGAPFREQLDERVLQLLAGQYEQARRPLEMVSDEHRALGERFIEALIALREAHAGDAAAAAGAVLRELDALSESLRKLSDLTIPTLALCWKVEGFGRYQAFDPPQFIAGSAAEVIVYCELRNFTSEQREDGLYHTELGMTVNLYNRIGESVLEVKDALIRDTCRTRRHDCFIPRVIRLPASLAAGEYTLKATVVDKLGGKVAESRTNLTIKPGW